jgi:hypothetical protein
METDSIESKHAPDWLDEAVRTSARSIPDDGFSTRVAHQLSTIRQHRRSSRTDWILWLIVIAGTIPAALRFPTGGVLDEIIALCSNPILLCLSALVVGTGIVGRSLLEQD